jgi:hypothetical protein
MRDVYQVLREKTNAIAQVRREVEALRSVSPFLADARQNPLPTASTLTGTELCDAFRTVAELLTDEAQDFDPGVRARLVEAGERDLRGRRRRFSSWISSPRWRF